MFVQWIWNSHNLTPPPPPPKKQKWRFTRMLRYLFFFCGFLFSADNNVLPKTGWMRGWVIFGHFMKYCIRFATPLILRKGTERVLLFLLDGTGFVIFIAKYRVQPIQYMAWLPSDCSDLIGKFTALFTLIVVYTREGLHCKKKVLRFSRPQPGCHLPNSP